jgi:acetyltransferase-like isoleucine patch superfamily enzyme
MIRSIKKFLFIKIYELLRFGNYISSTARLEIHKDSKVYGSRLDGNIKVAAGCNISRVELYGNIQIGRYSSLNGPNTDIVAEGGNVIIGQFCSIARNVSIQLSNHRIDVVSSYPIQKNIFKESGKSDFTSKGNVVIGNDVWIGSHSVILSGTKIHHGAVVAANSVVTGDIPPYAIVAGSPAKVIRYRFSEKVINRLLEEKWWDWELEKIKSNPEYFSKSLVEETNKNG